MVAFRPDFWRSGSRRTGVVQARRSKTFIVRRRAPKGPNRSAPLVSRHYVVAGAGYAEYYTASEAYWIDLK